MVQRESTKPASRKHTRQPPSIPFLWEERPGTAKKNWKPWWPYTTQIQIIPVVKLIASVPFNWEETPGKPLSCFSQPEVDPAILPPPETPTTTPLPLTYTEDYHNLDSIDAYLKNEVAYKQLLFHNNDQDFAADKQEGILDMDIESFSFETEGSFAAQTSLMANCLVSSADISYAIPMPKNLSATDMDHLESPSSPSSESNSSSSSYATGISSSVGTSFLEYLFPLYPPNSGFLHKRAYFMKGSLAPLELDSKSFHHESKRNGSIIVRSPATLEELIMLRRKRSCQRKASQIQKQDSSLKLMIKKAFGCCIFGSSIRMIERFQRRKKQLMLKLT